MRVALAMKQFHHLLPVLCLYATVVCCQKYGSNYKEAILKCNAYIDSMIQDVLKEHGDYFDPHFINNSLLTFQKKVVFIDFKGEAKLSEGYISGLRNLHRASSCFLSFENGRLKLSTDLEIDQMAFNFTGSMKAININKDISVRGDASKVLLSTRISLDTDGKDSFLEDLNVDLFKDLRIEVEGTRFLGWIEEPMKNSIAHFFKGLTEKLVEVEMKKLWVEKMKANPFSLEKFGIDVGDFEVTTTTEDDRIPSKLIYSVNDSNAYMDSVLSNRFLFEADYSKVEPYLLPDDRIDKVSILKEGTNFMVLQNGRLEHLTKLERIQDCSQPLLRAWNITFTCLLSFQQPLQFLYTAETHIGRTMQDINIAVLVDSTRLGVKVTQGIHSNVPNMIDFNVKNLGKTSIIADVPVMGPNSKFDKNVIFNHFSVKLRGILLGKLKEVLGHSIYKTPIHFLD